MSIWVIFKLLGSLALLMYGMKSMSESLQKLAGPQLRHVLSAVTTNRFTGLLTGVFVTAAVQSSTATTLLTVSFVNAGLLTLIQGISVILGANIGTTVTAWIMSLGFSFNISDFIYPAFFIGIILTYMKKRRIIGDFLFGVAFLFLGLATLKETGFGLVEDPGASAAISAFFSNFSEPNFFNSLFFLIIGSILTLCVQSSAAIMAITMILCSTGVLQLGQGVMLVLGENIGTTITANIVALGANTQARRAALAHFLINALGVIWVLSILPWFLNMVCNLVGYDLNSPDVSNVSVVLAGFHSAFNITNAFILIWFIPLLEKLVCYIIKPQKEDEEEDFRLRFITGGILSTAELSVLEARKELNHFADRTQRMFDLVQELSRLKDEKEFTKLYSRIEKYENICDSMEIEIGNYLEEVMDGRLSADTKGTIQAMLREVSEIESIGVSCYNLARSFNHKSQEKDDFTPEQYEHISNMFELVTRALTQMIKVLITGQWNDAVQSFNIETEIDNYRNTLKHQNVIDVSNSLYNYQMGVYYMDIINECEKLGDYVVNVVEARTYTKEKKE
ncbi:MAG: Na/Pi cotransporter family protein [Bacteroidaceae bacterium]|nr:Na/Pi cotransporter family protein [Bacteroidaceae bacterium]